MHWLYRALLNLLPTPAITSAGGEITLGAYVESDDLIVGSRTMGPAFPNSNTHLRAVHRAPANDQRARGSGLAGDYQIGGGTARWPGIRPEPGGQGSTFGMVFSL